MARKISPEQFVLKAVKVLPSSEEGSRHKGLRRRRLIASFSKYFDGKEDLDKTIGSLVKEGKLIAVRLVWKDTHSGTEHTSRGTISELVRLDDFPDKKVTEANPMLYLPDQLPDRLVSVTWADEAIQKILGS